MKIPDFGLAKTLDRGVLRTVEALLRAGKLNRVADLVAMSAPVAAFALAKLRLSIGDPLLIPTAAGVELTARARKLAAPLRDLLERITEILPTRELFDPAFCESTFVIAATDYANCVLGPKLAAAFAERAPRARLELVPLRTAAIAKALDAGEFDLALGTGFRETARVRSERLFGERFRCVARRGHPRVSKQLTARAYAAEPHVIVSPADILLAKLDPALSDPGRKRRAGVVVPHFLIAAEIAAHSDLVATLPERVARASDARLQVLTPPVKLPTFAVSQAWSAAADADPAQAWLRGLVAEIAADL
jgi:DNA-binding transcriptional LysR family regulator